MHRVVRVSVAVCAVALMAGCSNGADKQASSQDVVERTVLVTQTATPTPAASTTQTQGSPSPATTAPVDPAPPRQAPAGSAMPSSTPADAAKATSSPRIAAVQEALRRSGHYSGDVDGVEGATTTAAIRAFQREHGLTADGVAGPSFWDAVTGRSSSAPPSPSQAPSSSEAPDPVAQCDSDYAAWDAAVQANRRSAANAAHARGAAHGCNPNRWLPSRSATTHDPVSSHEKGTPCSMAEIGTYDAAGNVCTQDATDNPHWN